MSSRDIWAVVPMKVTTNSKQRLAGALSPQDRQKLAIAMFEDVMSALGHARGLSGILVVTIDPTVTAIAQNYGARILTDGAEDAHTGAVNAAARVLAHEGRGGMLSVPGDIPLVTAQEIDAIVSDHLAGRAFSIVPAHDARGSNAVLLTPPDAMPLQFGNDSHLPHIASAQALGLAVLSQSLPGIALDIDTPNDLAMLRRSPHAAGTKAMTVLQEIDGRDGSS